MNGQKCITEMEECLYLGAEGVPFCRADPNGIAFIPSHAWGMGTSWHGDDIVNYPY
jgi:hypothetical protein